MRRAAVVIAAVIAFVARASAQCCCDKASMTNGFYTSALEPGDLALALNEDDFEDYLDEWLAAQQETLPDTRGRARLQSGCSIRVNGDLGQPQPVYLTDNNYTVPAGSSGAIHLDAGNQLYVACPGSGRSLTHPQITTSATSGYIACVNGTSVSGAGWLNGPCEFGQLACSSHPAHQAEATTGRCYNDNLIIRIGYVVDETFYPLYRSCFDQNRLEVLYVWYEQTPANSVFQSNVDRPSWLVGTFFPGAAVNSIYTQVQQKATIAQFVGSELAEKYITNTQFLARGHLAAKTDFVFATAQRASFYFINAAPQWQPKNAGNWNWVEQVYLQNLRTRIGSAGYHTVIYTGTFGVTQLRDSDGRLVDIYLHVDANNNPQIPVPLYYYKVVYDESLRLGTAFVSINNPYYNVSEVQSLQFCRDQCRNNSAFDWLHWQPDRIDIGYSFCCTVPDFRRVVSHLPDFDVVDLLT